MVAHEHSVMPSTLRCTLGDRKDGFYRSIIIGSEAEPRALVINCERTQRTSSGRPVPEKGLGLCPLHDTSNYEKKLPAELKGRKGGVLLPMGISEGLRLMFQHNARFIIRVTIDSRNAITGLLETEGPEVFIGKIVNEEQSYKLQEYIVVPTQEKLDGAWPIPRFTSVNDPTQSRTPTRSKRPPLEIIPVNPHGPGNSLCRRASTWADNGPAYLRSLERIPNASPSTPRAPENLHDGRRPGKTGLTAFRGAAGGANRKESLGAEHNGPAASMRSPRNNIVSSERSIEEVGKNLCQLATETIGQRNGMVHPSLEITMPADEEEQNLDALLHEMQHPQRHRLPVRGVNWIEPTIVPSSQAVRESIDRSEPRAGRHEASLDSLLNAHARTGYSN